MRKDPLHELTLIIIGRKAACETLLQYGDLSEDRTNYYKGKLEAYEGVLDKLKEIQDRVKK
jgi:hypothetical protein